MASKKIGPKFYADVNKNKPPEYSNYEELEITWGKQEDYEIIKKVGRGKYSEVYEGINVNNDQRVVIKVLKPVKKKKIKREIKILQNLKGGPNVVKLIDIVRDPSSKSPCIITEWIDNKFVPHSNRSRYKILYLSSFNCFRLFSFYGNNA